MGLVFCPVLWYSSVMAGNHGEPELNQTGTSLLIFMESYNRAIPADFPHASVKALKEFQTRYPALFRHGDEWSINRHRKRLMDWLPSHCAD